MYVKIWWLDKIYRIAFIWRRTFFKYSRLFGKHGLYTGFRLNPFWGMLWQYSNFHMVTWQVQFCKLLNLQNLDDEKNFSLFYDQTRNSRVDLLECGADVIGVFSCFYWDIIDICNIVQLCQFEVYQVLICSVQFSSVAQSCPILSDPMDCSTPGFPVHNQLPEPTQTYVHWVSDAIQPSYPLSSPSPPAFNHSQHQGLFKWVRFLHQVAKVFEFQLQHQVWTGWISLQSKGFSSLQHHSWKASILQRSAFFIVQLLHPYMTTGKNKALTIFVLICYP